MRRPLAFVGLAILAGVVMAATVFRNDIAQATGLAQSVTVDNAPANAVPVREQNVGRDGNIKVGVQGALQLADEPARQPFQAQIQKAFDSDDDIACGYVSVPAGKRLVIETVTFRGFVYPDSGEYYKDVYVVTNYGAGGTVHYLIFSKIPQEPQWRASQAVRLYSDPESKVALCAQRWQTGVTPASFSGSLSGYFVNVS